MSLDRASTGGVGGSEWFDMLGSVFGDASLASNAEEEPSTSGGGVGAEAGFSLSGILSRSACMAALKRSSLDGGILKSCVSTFVCRSYDVVR